MQPAVRLPEMLLPLRAVQPLEGSLFPLKEDAGSKIIRGGKSRRLCRCALRGPGPAAGPPARLLGLLDHTFTEVRHFGVFYFLLVQLILSPKEQFQ